MRLTYYRLFNDLNRWRKTEITVLCSTSHLQITMKLIRSVTETISILFYKSIECWSVFSESPRYKHQARKKTLFNGLIIMICCNIFDVSSWRFQPAPYACILPRENKRHISCYSCISPLATIQFWFETLIFSVWKKDAL